MKKEKLPYYSGAGHANDEFETYSTHSVPTPSALRYLGFTERRELGSSRCQPRSHLLGFVWRQCVV